MSVKSENKVLTYEQAKELKFFMRETAQARARNSTLLDEVMKFKTKLDRLNETCVLIEKHFGKEIEELERKVAAAFELPEDELRSMMKEKKDDKASL